MDTRSEGSNNVAGRTAALELRLLGPMTVLRGGQPLELPRSRKARALLGLLATASRPLAREALCEMLWNRPADPRAELRSALTRLRSLLDEPGRPRVMADAQGLRLDLADAEVDVHVLEARVRGAADASASIGPVRSMALADGEFLQGLDIERAPAYGHWLLAERRRWRGLQVALLERMADHWPPHSDEALECLNRWLQLLPHDRRAHERLLDTLARRGALPEGDAHLAQAVRLFESEGQEATRLVQAWQQARERHHAAPALRELAPPTADAEAPAEARRASVAVMPFEELPPDSVGGFGRYLAHDVTSQLARLRSLFVIAQASTRVLQARGMGPDEAARVLDIDYVASGVLRRQGTGIGLSVQLVHTRSGRVIWADHLQSHAGEPFEMLDELCRRLVTAIADQVEYAERQRAMLKTPASLDAWEALHRGLAHMYRFRRDDNELARHWFSTSVRLEPGLSRAQAGLSFTHWQNAFQGWGERDHETELAWRHAHEALLADEQDPAAHWALGRAMWLRDRVAESLAELNHAVALSPSFSQGHYTLAFVHSQSGDAESAIASADRARNLSPFDPLLFGMLGARAMALMRLGRMDEAAEWALRAIARPNAHQHIRAIAAHCLALSGRLSDAQRVVAALRAEHPGYSVADFLQAMRFDAEGEQLVRRAAASIGLA